MEEAKRRLLDRLRTEIDDQRVIDAMDQVPREAFVPSELADQAYEDEPLPIGEGQTISQPFIVALMIAALEIRRSDKVLEVGTGSGYQAALLARIARDVVTIERHATLADSARDRLGTLGYANVEVFQAERGLGWPAGAPYDAIIVAAAAPKVPRELIDQLAEGGRMVCPVGALHAQELLKVRKSGGSYTVRGLGACRFVPLIGEGGWPESRKANGTVPF